MNSLITIHGTFRLSEYRGQRTAGNFSKLINDNASVFKRYFGVDLFPGSLNVDVSIPPSLQDDLDKGIPEPSLTIPRHELINMPSYIGNGQAWTCVLTANKFPVPINGWIFRRIGSRVPKGVIEIVAAPPALRMTYNLAHGEPVVINVSKEG